MTYETLLLELWIAGATVYVIGPARDRIRVEADGDWLTAEIEREIRRHKPRLLELARAADEDGRLELPARDYVAMFWAPRARWRATA